MPSLFFARTLSDELQTITVLDPGTETYTDTDDIVKERAKTAVTVANVDVQPVSGTSRLLPEGVRAESSHQAYVDLSESAAAKRAALAAGRHIQTAGGVKLKVLWVGDYSTHLVVALQGA